MVKPVRCDGCTLKANVMRLTFVLLTFLILEEASGKKRVVIHVPSKINNIHHHHVKKVIVYKPVPVKCHGDEGKHDWREGWASTHKDEWIDKRPVPLKHSPWHGEEAAKGGYMSGERISSDNWEAGTIKQFKSPHTEIEPEVDEEPVLDDYFIQRPSKKKPPSAKGNPSEWKVNSPPRWVPGDALKAPNPPIIERPTPTSNGVGKKSKPKETYGSGQPAKTNPQPSDYTTYKVVKKVVKQRARKKPTDAPKAQWYDDGPKANEHKPPAVKRPSYTSMKDHLPSMQGSGDFGNRPNPHHNPDLQTTSARPNSYYNADLYTSSSRSKFTYDQEVFPSSSIRPGLYHNHDSPGSSLRPPPPFYDQETYFSSSSKPKLYNQDAFSPMTSHTKSYYDQDMYTSSSRPATYDQDTFSFNSNKIKALLDQNVFSAVNKAAKPMYELNVHNFNDRQPNSASYQMRYVQDTELKPTAFLINHK